MRKSTEEGVGQRGRDGTLGPVFRLQRLPPRCLHQEQGRPSRGREGACAGWGSVGPRGFWLTGYGPPEWGENRLRRVWSCPRGGEAQLSPQPGPQNQEKGRAWPWTGHFPWKALVPPHLPHWALPDPRATPLAPSPPPSPQLGSSLRGAVSRSLGLEAGARSGGQDCPGRGPRGRPSCL